MIEFTLYHISRIVNPDPFHFGPPDRDPDPSNRKISQNHEIGSQYYNQKSQKYRIKE